MPGKRQKRVRERLVDAEDMGFDYNTTSTSTDPKIVHTKYGDKMVSGYVSTDEISQHNAPILVKYPILGDLFLIFRSEHIVNDMVPFSNLKNFLTKKIDNNPEHAQVLYHFLARDEDLIEAVNQFQYLVIFKQDDKTFVRKMPMPDEIFGVD